MLLFLCTQQEDKENEVNQLQNDRQDFDMVMELALEKQKQLEKDLRRSLDVSKVFVANLSQHFVLSLWI